MQVQIEDVSPVEKKLRFEIPWDMVSARLGSAYDELSRSVSLKGFRKGKVPRSVIQQMFGKRVRAEVTGDLIRDSFVQAVQEHNLRVVSEPHVHDEPQIKKGEPFKFEAHVEVRAELALEEKDYAGLELTKRKVEISDEAVQHALEQLQREQTDLESIEGRSVTASTDVLSISITGSIGDQEVNQPQYMVDLEDTAREGLPGLARALTGIPIDVVDHPIELELPKGEDETEARVAKLTVSILDARKKVVPELDDELAKDTGRAETLEGLRKVLRDDLESRAAEEVQRELREAALKALVKRNQIPVAEGLVQRATNNQIQRLKMMLGVGPDEDVGDKLGGDIHDKLKEGAADDVRGELLIDALAEKESIEVAEAEIDARVAELAKYQGKPPNRLKAELERDGRLEDIQFSMRREKALDLLIGRAKVTEGVPESDPVEESGEGEGEGEAKAKAKAKAKDAGKTEKSPKKKAPAKKPQAKAKTEDPG